MSYWHDRFDTGHPQVDSEHREIFSRLQDIRAAIDRGDGRARIVELIVVLQKYVLGHFGREEAHMLQVRCPAHADNVAAHREFSRRVEAWIAILTNGNAPLSVVNDIHAESVVWISAHILNVDCRLRACPAAR